MKHKELKRFTFTRPPTGLAIAELVKKHELYGWSMDIEKKHVTPDHSMQLSMSNWVYEVTFESAVAE